MTDNLTQESSVAPVQITEQIVDDPAIHHAPEEEFRPQPRPTGAEAISATLHSMFFTGVGFTVNLPQTFSERRLATVRVTPVIPSPNASSFKDVEGTPTYTNDRPICTILAVPEGTSITRTETLAPSLNRSFASAFRFWKGSMSIRFRVASSNFTSGILVFSLHRNKGFFELLNSTLGDQPLTTRSPNYKAYDLGVALASPHFEMDLSKEREIVIPVPPLPHATDEHQVYESTYLRNAGITPSQDKTILQDHYFVNITSRGSITSNNDTLPLVFLIDQQFGEDMQFAGHVGFTLDVINAF